ncbi:MAG: hypothetical protein WKF95_00170 [Rubrobacter sp.]
MSKNYLTDVEVAKRLSKPYTEMYRMANLGQLPVKFVDDDRMFSKEAIGYLADQAMRGDGSVSQGSSRPPINGDGYFKPYQLAHALQRRQEEIKHMIQRGEIRTEQIEGQRWISREEVEKVILKRIPGGRDRIRKRLPAPRFFPSAQGSSSESNFASETREDRNVQTVAEASERAVMKAAQDLETSINKVRQMIAEGNLVVDLESGSLVAAEYSSGSSAKHEDKSEPADVTRSQKPKHPPTAPNRADPKPVRSEDEAEVLEKEKQTLAEELEHEIDQLDIQLENLRSTKDRTIEDLGADIEELELKVRDLETELEQERETREEAEHTVGSLQGLREEEPGVSTGLGRKTAEDREQPTSDQHSTVRGFLETFGKNVRDALGADEPDEQDLAQLREQLRHEREGREKDKSTALYDYAQLENVYRDLDEYNQALKDEINDIKSSSSGSPTREELEAKLLWNGVRREDLEKSLALEKQRTSQLESDSRTLAEIQRLLTGGAPRSAESAAAPSPPETSNEVSDVSNAGILHIQTRHGEWAFRPPFTLESDEVELIRLVAGEDEMTAEQIKRRTGRRRSVDDLDELLDRLLAEGMEPIKESSDRYRLDPDILQD